MGIDPNLKVVREGMDIFIGQNHSKVNYHINFMDMLTGFSDGVSKNEPWYKIVDEFSKKDRMFWDKNSFIFFFV